MKGSELTMMIGERVEGILLRLKDNIVSAVVREFKEFGVNGVRAPRTVTAAKPAQATPKPPQKQQPKPGGQMALVRTWCAKLKEFTRAEIVKAVGNGAGEKAIQNVLQCGVKKGAVKVLRKRDLRKGVVALYQWIG